MKLKKLIAYGFKSFADRTEFVFDEGISCIVGPNGCGKSNVVDAVRWVLGEQSAKSLRGSEMMDIIFSGSSARRPSGHAEVTLVFENADGVLQPNLPDQQSPPAQVAITRKLFRSGQSEYLINKITCRLRDIREMLMDTGVGAHAYAVIEQGQIDAFLQASHDERRAIFDEASGISKYKARKKETMRKLERVEQNMLRLGDVLGEVERRLRSIKYQAGKARNYQAYSEQLNELKSLFVLSQYHLFSQNRKELERTLDQGTDSLAAINTRIDQYDSAFNATEAETEDLERTARDLRVQIATIGGQITTWQERQEANKTRIQEFADQSVVLAGRCEELEAKIETFKEELLQRQQQKQVVENQTTELNEKYESLRQAHHDNELKISKLEADLADEKNGTMDLIRRAAQFHNEVQASAIRQDNLSAQRERLTGRAKDIAQSARQLLTERATVETKLNEVTETLDATRQRLEKANDSNRRATDSEHELQRELSASREERSGLQSRVKTLGEMQQRLEGVGTGVKRVLDAGNKGSLACIRGMLGDFLHADVEFAPLIEAALGQTDQQLIATSFDELSAASDELANVLGKNASVEIWCLDRIANWADDFDASQCPQVMARAIDWVRFEPWVATAVWKVLGRTLIVETLADAKTVAKIAPAGYRFVTKQGEVLEANGLVRLGWANRTAGVVTRRSELAELRNQLEKLTARIETLENQRQSARGQREHLEKVMQSLRTAVYEDSMEQTSCKGRLGQLDGQIADLKREEPIIAGDLRNLAEEIESAVKAQHEAKEKSEELKNLHDQRQEQIKQLEQQVADARAGRNQRLDEMTEVKVALAQAREKSLAIRDTLASLTRQQDQMTRDFETSKAEIETNRQRRAEAEAAIEKAANEIETLYSRHETLNRDAEDIEESRTSLKEKLDEIRLQLVQQRKAQEQANEQVNTCRVKLGEIDANITNLITRTFDELGMDLLEHFKDYSHDEQRDWDAVAEQIKELDGKIKRLGNVNLDAITEQDELEVRQALYNGQIKDIQESHHQLDELIKRINRQSRQLFQETFDAVRENFQGLFRKLFGGGRADILLTNPDDVLESGIDIVARPPGKELRSLTLLSGGEQTMTALALLFSIFKAKPSPFCLLDEVDAALDEANTERFSHLLTEFIDSSQFIVISHAKRTMSMANVLYGVTMQEPGVSKRISVKFEDAEKHLEKDLQPVG